MAPSQFEKVVGLQDHVVEFKKGQRLLAVEPQLDGLECQHPIDREVAADIAQERYVLQRVEPIGIVDEQCVGRAVAEFEETVKSTADTGDIGADLGIVEQLSGFVLARRVTDPRGAATHQHDRPVAGALQPAQHHDLHQRADMQAVRRRIEADIGGHRRVGGEGVEGVEIRALVQVTALDDRADEIGLGRRHDGSSLHG